TTGGVGPLTYKFYVFNGTSWTLARDWRTSPSTPWTTTAAVTYSVQVWVRNAGSTTAYDAVGTKNGFTVTVGSHCARPRLRLLVTMIGNGPGAASDLGA